MYNNLYGSPLWKSLLNSTNDLLAQNTAHTPDPKRAEMRQQEAPGLIISIGTLILQPYVHSILLTQRNLSKEGLQVLAGLEHVTRVHELLVQATTATCEGWGHFTGLFKGVVEHRRLEAQLTMEVKAWWCLAAESRREWLGAGVEGTGAAYACSPVAATFEYVDWSGLSLGFFFTKENKQLRRIKKYSKPNIFVIVFSCGFSNIFLGSQIKIYSSSKWNKVKCSNFIFSEF